MSDSLAPPTKEELKTLSAEAYDWLKNDVNLEFPYSELTIAEYVGSHQDIQLALAALTKGRVFSGERDLPIYDFPPAEHIHFKRDERRRIEAVLYDQIKFKQFSEQALRNMRAWILQMPYRMVTPTGDIIYVPRLTRASDGKFAFGPTFEVTLNPSFDSASAFGNALVASLSEISEVSTLSGADFLGLVSAAHSVIASIGESSTFSVGLAEIITPVGKKQKADRLDKAFSAQKASQGAVARFLDIWNGIMTTDLPLKDLYRMGSSRGDLKVADFLAAVPSFHLPLFGTDRFSLTRGGEPIERVKLSEVPTGARVLLSTIRPSAGQILDLGRKDNTVVVVPASGAVFKITGSGAGIQFHEQKVSTITAVSVRKLSTVFNALQDAKAADPVQKKKKKRAADEASVLEIDL